jgi:outer membrane lipoprotein-sorting protein
MTPQFEGSGYRYQLAYVDKREYIFRKMEYYDRKKTLLKTLDLNDYRKYMGRYWRPLMLTMVNHQSGRSTIMIWKDVVYQNGLNDNDFSINALKRSR